MRRSAEFKMKYIRAILAIVVIGAFIGVNSGAAKAQPVDVTPYAHTLTTVTGPGGARIKVRLTTKFSCTGTGRAESVAGSAAADGRSSHTIVSFWFTMYRKATGNRNVQRFQGYAKSGTNYYAAFNRNNTPPQDNVYPYGQSPYWGKMQLYMHNNLGDSHKTIYAEPTNLCLNVRF